MIIIKKLTFAILAIMSVVLLAGCSNKETMSGDMDGIKRSVVLTSKNRVMKKIEFSSSIDTRNYFENYEEDEDVAVDELVASISDGYRDIEEKIKKIDGVTFTYDVTKESWSNTLTYDYSNTDKESLEDALFINEFSGTKDLAETKKILNDLGYVEKK